MQIHELNTLSGSLGSSTYLAVDNGTDTGKVAVSQLLEPVSDLKADLSETTDNIWKFNPTYSFTRYQYLYNVNLPAGTYTISALITSDDTAQTECRVAFMDGSSAQLTYKTLKRGQRAYKSFTLSDTCQTIILYASTTSSNSTGKNATWANIMIQSGNVESDYIPPVTALDFVARSTANEAMDDIASLTGYKKPNLLNTHFTPTTASGITISVDEDWIVTLNGTATASSSTGVTVTLPRGDYIASGITDGTFDTHRMRLMRADDSYQDFYDGEVKFSITDDTEQIRLYIRWNNGATLSDVKIYPMIRSAKIYNGTYAKYGEYAIYKPIQELIDYTQFNWSGKKMNALGDSIVAGSNGNFIDVIGGILNLDTVRNYGIGGSLIASTQEFDSEYPPACTRYIDMDDDADIIIVHAGTNDYTAQVPIGDTNSTNITTWNGALNVLMQGLRTKYPTALIIFSNILDRIQDNNTDRYPIVCQTYRDALEAACYRNHIIFYDGFKNLNFDFHAGYYDHVYTDDGLHPNQTGANVMGRSIAGFIKWH